MLTRLLCRATCGPLAAAGASAALPHVPWLRATRSARWFGHHSRHAQPGRPRPHCRMGLHPPRCGGTCVAVFKRKGASVPTLCGAEEAHVWYAGPTCKRCYERDGRQSKKSKGGTAREEVEDASGGDILVEVLKVCGSRCGPPALPLPA